MRVSTRGKRLVWLRGGEFLGGGLGVGGGKHGGVNAERNWGESLGVWERAAGGGGGGGRLLQRVDFAVWRGGGGFLRKGLGDCGGRGGGRVPWG